MAAAIGIDIGARQVRALAIAAPTREQAREGARARVVAHAEVPRRAADGAELPLAAVVGEAMERLGVRGEAVVQSADVQALVRFVPTMGMSAERLERVLRLELQHHAQADGDLAADALAIDGAGEPMHCCVVAQPPQVRDCLAVLRGAGVRVEALHHAAAALANATLPSAPVRGEQIGLLIDIGAATSSVAVFGEDRFLACRQVSIGGEAFTTALAQGGDLAGAEQRKRAGGGQVAALPPPPAPVPSPAPADVDLSLDDGIPFDPLPSVPAPMPLPAATPPPERPAGSSGVFELDLDDGTEPSFHPAGQETKAIAVATLGPEQARQAEALFTQVSSALLWFRAQLKREQLAPAAVFLTGGGAGLAGLAGYLERRFSLPVRVLDPFAAVDGAEAVAGPRPEQPHEWATALGLALASRRMGLHGTVRIDLRPEHDVRRAHARAHRPFLVAAGVLLVAATACAGIELWRRAASEGASLEAIEAYKQKRTELTGQLARLDVDKAALSEDLRAVAGRIYAGRDLLLAIRALKERAGSDSPYVWVTRLETAGVGREEADDGGTARLRAVKQAFRDTAIDRGALLVEGRVRFESDKTDTALQQYFVDYQSKLEGWRADPHGAPLFRSSLVIEHGLEHAEGARKGRPAGSFRFLLRLDFQPTELAEVTALSAAPGGGR